MSPFRFETTADEACSALAERIKGKSVLITGVTKGGLGFETARAISLHEPSLLILAGRSQEKNLEAEQEIKSAVPSVAVKCLRLDLGSFTSVRQAAAEVNGWPEDLRIDILINNAGIMGVPFRKTEDGIEAHFATNHLGHFLFTNLIMGRITGGDRGARIVNVSSWGHHRSDIRWNDWNFQDGKDYAPLVGYGQSKTANILFGVSLAEKLRSKGVLAYNVHPGSIFTNITLSQDLKTFQESGILDENFQPKDTDFMRWKSIGQGASTSIVAAFDPSIAERNGAYLNNCQVDDSTVTPYALNRESAERLWKLSEALVGQKFEY